MAKTPSPTAKYPALYIVRVSFNNYALSIIYNTIVTIPNNTSSIIICMYLHLNQQQTYLLHTHYR
nr:MAG TPA: hypothetical protein [Bacteriophage sp.]